MISKTLSVISLVLLLIPASLAWNREECEAVGWDHPDCHWGPGEPGTEPQTPGTHSSAHSGSAHFLMHTWAIQNSTVEMKGNSTMGCLELYRVDIMPRIGNDISPTVTSFLDVKKKVCRPISDYSDGGWKIGMSLWNIYNPKH